MQQRNVIWRGRAMPRTLSQADFQQAAERLGCDVAAIRAVWEVEAGGRHFLEDGSVIRRFEPHHVSRHLWGQIGFEVRPGEAPWRASLRLSSERMFQRAAALDLEAACRASSWGAPQIMGFNHRDAGFSSPEAMVRHMAEGAPQQLGAFVQLLEGWGLAPALRGHDWRAFAARYNGSGQVERYARLIEAAYRRHAGRASPVVLRVGDRGQAVAELQRALGIEDDGAFGPQTLEAVREFQRREGLAVDGVVGARTWAALGDGTPTPSPAGGMTQRPQVARPPKQPTTADAALDEVTRWTGALGAVIAALAGAREALPDDAVTLLIGGAVVAGVVAASAWAIRRARS